MSVHSIVSSHMCEARRTGSAEHSHERESGSTSDGAGLMMGRPFGSPTAAVGPDS